MIPLMTRQEAHPLHPWRGALSSWLGIGPVNDPDGEKIGRLLFVFFVALVLAFLSLTAKAQAVAAAEDSSGAGPVTAPAQVDPFYVRPPASVRLRNYVFDGFGPYPIAGAGIAAAINQASNAPPEWGQGAGGYGKRFGSDFGIAVVGTTSRYGLATALKEDTLYYRCECQGLLPRVKHAMFSTLTARRGDDGHRVFSLPALIAPYAGSMTAVYGWYPSRFSAKDAFRIGNYSLLAYMGENISLEFFYSGPHSLLARMHLNNAHAAPVQGPN